MLEIVNSITVVFRQYQKNISLLILHLFKAYLVCSNFDFILLFIFVSKQKALINSIFLNTLFK